MQENAIKCQRNAISWWWFAPLTIWTRLGLPSAMAIAITSQRNFEMKMMKAFALRSTHTHTHKRVVIPFHCSAFNSLFRVHSKGHQNCVLVLCVSVIFIKILLHKPRKMNTKMPEWFSHAFISSSQRAFTPKISMHFKLHTSVTYLHVIFHLNCNHYNEIFSCVFARLFVCLFSSIHFTNNKLIIANRFYLEIFCHFKDEISLFGRMEQ